jgi:hypothetical protein
MNFTARQIAQGTRPKLHMDVDTGTETVEEVVDTTAKLAGKRMRYMVLNEDIARPTSNRFAELEMGLDSQEIIAMFDSTWGNHYSPEKKPPT